MERYVVIIISKKCINTIGFFVTHYDAYKYVNEMVKTIQNNPNIQYCTPNDDWWKADFDPDRYDENIPYEIRISKIINANDYSHCIWYAPKNN